MTTTAATVTQTIDRNILRFTSSPKTSAPKVQTGYRQVAAVLPEGTERKTITALFTAYLMTQEPATKGPDAEATYVALLNSTLGTNVPAADFDSLTS